MRAVVFTGPGDNGSPSPLSLSYATFFLAAHRAFINADSLFRAGLIPRLFAPVPAGVLNFEAYVARPCGSHPYSAICHQSDRTMLLFSFVPAAN